MAVVDAGPLAGIMYLYLPVREHRPPRHGRTVGGMSRSRALDQAAEASGNEAVGGANGKILLSAQEAAALMGIHRSSLYNLMALGQLQTVKIGRRRLVPRAALAEFIARNSQAGLG